MTLKLETLLLRAHYAAYSWGYEAGSKGSCLDTDHAADKAATLAKELRDALASTGAATPPADTLRLAKEALESCVTRGELPFDTYAQSYDRVKVRVALSAINETKEN